MGGVGCRHWGWGRVVGRVTMPWLPCTCHILTFSCSSTS